MSVPSRMIGRVLRDPRASPNEEGHMEAPLNIAQFNALLHSKERSQMMSALHALTTVRDLDIFVSALNPMQLWGGW